MLWQGPVYDVVTQILTEFFKCLWSSIKKTCNPAQRCRCGIIYFQFNLFQGLWNLISSIYNGYISILVKLTIWSLPYGIIGDIVLTLVTLLWMLWPVGVAYFVGGTEKNDWLIPTGAVSLVLMVVGY